jgi:hypothetical protein
MPRPILFFAGAWLLALAGPAFAADPDDTTTPTNTSTAGGLTVRALSVGDEEVMMGLIPVGIAACNTDAKVAFEIDGVPNERESIDVYLGEGCNAMTRTDDTTDRCEYIGNFAAGSSKGLSVLLSAKQLLRNDCETERQDTPKLWFLAVMSRGSAEDVGMNYGMLSSLRLDTRPPNAPSNVQGGTGEKQIPVEWETSDSDLEGFVVLIDPQSSTGGGGGGSGSAGSSGGAGSGDDDDGGMDSQAPTPSGGGNASSGDCGSDVLTPGGSAAGLPSRIRRKEVNGATASGLDLGPGDIDGDSAAIAVIAVDEAGNESLLSDLACVRVVPTESFWDRYQQGDAAVEEGCPCTALGPAQLQSAWPVGLSLSLIALSARRRRRS